MPFSIIRNDITAVTADAIVNTAIQLAIGLHLSLEQTQDLLASAGYVLTRSDKRDVVVEYYIQKKIYKVIEIDIALEQYGLACLGKY